jgi:hypothetical protein
MPGGKKTTKLDRCVSSVMKDGKSEDSAYAICQASISAKKDDTKKSIEHHGTTFPGYNKPTKSNRDGKKKMVLAKSGDKVKVIHYGDTNYKHNYSKEAKSSFRARHKCDEQKDKLTASYWACKDLWPTGSTKKSADKEIKGGDPCWKGYEMVGHKIKNGKKVPNCVPKSTKKSGSFSMKKVNFNKDEVYTIKGLDGETYVFHNGELFFEGPTVQRATVLKSLRTEKGAADWLSLMSKSYPNAVIMDTETLKSFSGTLKASMTDEVEGKKGPKMDLPFHVVNVEGVSEGDEDEMSEFEKDLPTGELAQDSDELMEDEEQEQDMSMTQVAQILHDAEKLHEMIVSEEIHLEPWMSKKLVLVSEYLNALAENLEHEDGDVPTEDGYDEATPSSRIDDDEDDDEEFDPDKLTSLPPLPKTALDEIVKSVLKNIAIKSEETARRPRRPGGMSQYQEELAGRGKPDEPDEPDESEGTDFEKSITGKIFKSLNAARQWNRFENPDKDRYYIDIMREKDVRKSFSKSTGLNAKYIVRDRFEEEEGEMKGSFGNKLVKKGY